MGAYTFSRDDHKALVIWRLYDPTKPLNLSRAAFAQCHPASLRRIGFAAIERGGRVTQPISRGYGTVFVPDSGDYKEFAKAASGLRNSKPVSIPGQDIFEYWGRVSHGAKSMGDKIAFSLAHHAETLRQSGVNL